MADLEQEFRDWLGAGWDGDQRSEMAFSGGWRAAQEDAAAQLAAQQAENARLRAALTGLAMRQFRADGTYCWCDEVVIDPAQHDHDPDCVRARAALPAVRRAGSE